MGLIEALILILILCWVLGLGVFKVTTGLIHLLLIIVLVLVVVRVLQGRTPLP